LQQGVGGTSSAHSKWRSQQVAFPKTGVQDLLQASHSCSKESVERQVRTASGVQEEVSFPNTGAQYLLTAFYCCSKESVERNV